MRFRNFGWGWQAPNLTKSSIIVMRKISSRRLDCPWTRKDTRDYLRAIAILGQYVYDNDCDLEGRPLMFGAIGDLEKEVEAVAMHFENRRHK